MTKSELIEDISLQTPEIQEKDVELVVNTMLKVMSDALSDGRRIEIRGFGSFVPRLRKARAARNPRTGQDVKVEEKYVPFFAVGKELFERINQEKKTPW